jgi:hypothetical protein
MKWRAALRLAALAGAGATLASGASMPAVAQPGAPFAPPFGPVPKEIHGVACEARAGDADFAPSLRCAAADPMKQPSISVAVSDRPRPPTRAELVANERLAYQNRPIFNVIREEDFAPPADPGAIGFRGLYQTELGNRYVWAVYSKGKLIRVLVIVFAPTDFAAMTADIEGKIFGVSPTAAGKDD